MAEPGKEKQNDKEKTTAQIFLEEVMTGSFLIPILAIITGLFSGQRND